MVEPYLVMRGMCKSFPGVAALDEASLEVHAGECHALVGENGAGKSTLMKVLAGAVLPASGVILLGGRMVEIRSPLDVWRCGVAMIYHELNLLRVLPVVGN